MSRYTNAVDAIAAVMALFRIGYRGDALVSLGQAHPPAHRHAGLGARGRRSGPQAGPVSGAKEKRMSDQSRACQNLWAAVLLRAFKDATGQISGNLTWFEKRSARDWLTDYRQDFARACEFAGIDPGAVHEKALRLRAADWNLEKVNAKKAA